jgi:radical SAM superfamily enzyme YgiQ (UPF0313 family)
VPRERISDIDALSWPAWDGIPLDTYLDRGFGMDEYNLRSMPMLASRGCPYRCTFCSSPQMWGTTWMARDPDDVVREIRHYVERHGIQHVEFHDLTTIIDRRWILRFTEKLLDACLTQDKFSRVALGGARCRSARAAAPQRLSRHHVCAGERLTGNAGASRRR